MFWASSQVTERVMERRFSTDLRAKFIALDEEKRRNVVTYVVEPVVTTFALVAQIYGGQEILRFSDAPTQTQLDWVIMALQSIAVLYLWELIYRLRFGWPLLTHHLMTLLMLQLATCAFDVEQQIHYIRGGLMLGFYATTEQMSFVALFCYRMNVLEKYQAVLFNISAAITFVIKLAVTVGSVVYYIHILRDGLFVNGWGTFIKYSFLPLLAILFVAQLYACYVLRILARKCAKEYEKTNQLSDGNDQDFDANEEPDVRKSLGFSSATTSSGDLSADMEV